jgi:demethoxyubiquinone hydroxylase (CLK1/Coq7/Cat5 family)
VITLHYTALHDTAAGELSAYRIYEGQMWALGEESAHYTELVHMRDQVSVVCDEV